MFKKGQWVRIKQSGIKKPIKDVAYIIQMGIADNSIHHYTEEDLEPCEKPNEEETWEYVTLLIGKLVHSGGAYNTKEHILACMRRRGVETTDEVSERVQRLIIQAMGI